MRQVKVILTFCLGAVYASSWWLWWACHQSPAPVGIFAVTATVVLVIFVGVYLMVNWNEQ